MKKLTALLTTSLLAVSMLTGCATKYYYNDDKAISLTAEYMKEKYGKEIKVIRTHHVGLNEHYVGVKFKLDEHDVEVPDEKTYEVRVYIEDDGKTHYVKCDNYMNTLFEPVFKQKITEILNENGIEFYDLDLSHLQQIGARDTAYYLAGFSIPDENLRIENVLNEYDLWFECWIDISEFKYNSELKYNNIQNIIEGVFMPIIYNDDIIRFRISVYNDSEYQKYKLSQNENSGRLTASKEIEFRLKQKEN